MSVYFVWTSRTIERKQSRALLERLRWRHQRRSLVRPSASNLDDEITARAAFPDPQQNV